MKTLLIIDMLNDFCKKDGALYVGKQVEPVIKNVKKAIKIARKEETSIVYLCDEHSPDDEELKLFPAHCVVGSHGECIIDDLEPDSTNYIIFKKKHFSGASPGSNALDFLEDSEEIEVCGLCTSICVMETVSDLARYTSAKIKILKDACCDLTEDAHEMALNRMKTLFGAEIK